MGCGPAYAGLAADFEQRHGVELASVGAIGVSEMMHGYLAFDGEVKLLTPLRTWRNTNTGVASHGLGRGVRAERPAPLELTHLYQALLDPEERIRQVAFVTTLAGYVHW